MIDLSPYDDTINAAAQEWGHDPNMLRALIQQESGGNPNAVSSAGARGLTGIMPPTASGLGMTDPRDVNQQIFGAAKYLAEGRDKEGTHEGALLYYHGGPDWRKSYGPESAGYVPGVAAKYTALSTKKATGAATVDGPAAPSDDDFLKSIAPPAAPTTATSEAAPSDDDFLKSTGAVQPAPIDIPTMRIERPETDETRRIGDLMTPGPPSSTPPSVNPLSFGVNNGVNVPGVSGPPNALDIGEVGQAIKQGYAGGAVVTPAGVNAADRVGLGWVPRGVNMLSGAAGAVYEGAKDVGAQAVNALAPGAGRDFAQGVDLASPFMVSAARPPASTNLLAPNASIAREAGAAGALDRAAPLSPEFKANPLAAGVEMPPPTTAPASANPNLLANPVRGPDAPPPQSIPNGLTPEQIAEFKNIPDELPPAKGPIKTPEDAAARADEIIKHFASIGNTKPLPGATGALPTITGNSGLATLYRAVRDSDTPVPFTTLENASKTDAMGQLKTMTGTPDDLAGAISTRATTTKPMYDKAWANKTEADPSAAIQQVQDLMKSPAKQNDTVMAELPSILKKLQGETDPEQLKGISDNIDATMDRLNTEGKADRETKRVMATVKESITPAISDAAPGFDAAQAEYAKQSRGIDQMKYLQSRKLTDLQGNPTLGNMRSTIDDIGKKQAGDKFHPADSVTPENLQILQRLHDQMQREQLTQSAGKALGSNTFQNLATSSKVGNLAGYVGNGLAGGLVGGGIDLATGGHGFGGMLAGNALANAAKYVSQRQAVSSAARDAAGHKMLMNALRDRLLNIDNQGVHSLGNAAQRP